VIDDVRAQATILTRQIREIHRDDSPPKQFVDLNEMVIESERTIKRIVIADVIVTLNLASTGTLVSVNPDKIERILLRLLLNSVAAIPGGGWITLKTSVGTSVPQTQSLDAPRASSRFVRLSLTDTGVRSNDEHSTALRSTTAISDSKTICKISEMASDLSAIKTLVEDCGGRMELTTSVEAGTCIEIYLPSARVDPDVHRTENVLPVTSAPLRFNSQTILLVEDEPLLRKFIKRALASQGFHVIDAQDGNAAIAAAVENGRQIQLLLTDLKLPGLSGREIADKLRTLFPGLPVIFMSGHSSESEVLKGMSTEAISFLQKPFQIDELLSQLRDQLTHSFNVS
jgi:CheY-like chemotaxis protein